MQIHELNNYPGLLGSSVYLAVDDGSDTGKISVQHLLEEPRNEISDLDTVLNARIDNIIAGGAAPSEAEIIDARLGASELGSKAYASLGDAIRGQISDICDPLIDSQLINPTRVENYYANYNDGSLTHNGSYGYIEATGISAYKLLHIKTNNPNGGTAICFYKANGDWISSVKTPDVPSPFYFDDVIKVPDGADIIRVSCLKAYLTSASVSTTLKEFLQGIDNELSIVIDPQLTDPKKVLNYYCHYSNGTLTYNTSYAYIEAVGVSAYKALHIKTNNPNGAPSICFYDKDGAWISSLKTPDVPSPYAYDAIIELPAGTDIIRVSCLKEYIDNASVNTTLKEMLSSINEAISDVPDIQGVVREVALGGNVVGKVNSVANIPAASASANGYMSKEDKQKLDNIIDPGSITISGSGVTKNASAYGFLPTNDGVTNATNLQAAINALGGGGLILVDYPGTYEISRSIIVPSNTELIFGENVYIKRVTDSQNKFGRFMFVNSGALDGTYNENIKIKGLKALPNGNLDATAVRDISAEAGLRGLVVMARIKNLVIEDFQVIDLNYVQYSAQIAFFENVRIENVRIETAKDGLHFGTGNGFIIRNCYFLTNDDPIALNAIDYPNSNVGIGDITNGVIENIYLLAPEPGSGFSTTRGMLMLSGAWKNWKSGNSYQKYGDVCVNNGVIYQTYSPQGPTSDQLVSTVPPTHQSGAQMYSDGLQWLAKQNVNAVLSANIKNVAFRNIYVYRDVTCLFMILSSESDYLRSIYPGSDQTPNENITFENVHFLYDGGTLADSLALIYNNTNNIIVKDSVLDQLSDVIVFKNDYSEYPSAAKANIALIGNYYGTSGKVFKGISSSKQPTIKASICGSMKSDAFTYSTENVSATALSNDLI